MKTGGGWVGGGRWWCGVLLKVVVAAGIVFANTSGGRGGGWWCGVLLEVVVAAGIAFANARRGGGWWKVVVWCGSGGGRGNRVCERERGEGVAPPTVPACWLVPACACAHSFVCSFVFIRGLFMLACLCWSPLPGLLSLSFVCVKYKVSKHIIIKLLTFTSEL